MINRPSGTAEGIAYMRYYESLRPPAQRICNDYLAYHFMAWWVKAAALACRPLPTAFMDWAFERKGKGVSGYIAVRTRMFDEYVLKGAAEGASQYVVMGAGLDSRAYRFADQLAGVRIFEVDHPSSQAAKKQRVIKHFGKLPSHVRYVPVDFTRDDLLDRLSNAGYEPGLPTLFTLEGVVMYLDVNSVLNTLSFIHENSGSASSVIFDYVYLAALDGRIKNRVITHMNSLKWIFHEPILFGIEQGEAESFLRANGFKRAEDYPPQRLYELFLKPAAPERPISDVYAIAVGYKD
jgi:methyltransferase (TIGR00027 family)